jgi:trehalose 6-phosphate phosphatase
MKLLFSETGMSRLAEIARPGLLCAFDFDGTLAPIVKTPSEARLPDEMREHLLRLSDYAPVAIITGRSLQDIRERVGFAPDFLIGNHGIEGVPGWESYAAEHEAQCRSWHAQLADALHNMDPGISLEDKRYSLSVHYRLAHDPAAAFEQLAAAMARLAPSPRVIEGKFVLNLLAPDARHKGDALVQLMQASKARSALYIGDDVTDEDVFRMRRENVLSIRVEHGASSAADFYLPHLRDMTLALTHVIERLRSTGARNWLEIAMT